MELFDKRRRKKTKSTHSAVAPFLSTFNFFSYIISLLLEVFLLPRELHELTCLSLCLNDVLLILTELQY